MINALKLNVNILLWCALHFGVRPYVISSCPVGIAILSDDLGEQK
jgi:hypothetical protein